MKSASEELDSGAANAGRGFGTVYLVGAGPGDPKLITVGGMEALKRADVVVYDRLAHPKLLDYAPAGAERIYVGKMADRHTMTQDDINSTLAEQAKAGKSVVRLKGGDPFVFGRGGEEAEYLRERGIGFVIVPGISSSIAAPAYAGIPVTHRDASSSFAVITGHERAESRESGGRAAGDAEQRRRWDKIAYAADTLIFLMGVESIDEISGRLIEYGRAPETPVAMVRWGTWAGRQETLVATLGTVAQRVREQGFKAPAVTVVGDVVNWRDRLRWWDNRPLSGKRIVVTRAREQASALIDALETLGADTIEFPTIKVQPPRDNYQALERSLSDPGRFDWCVLTSANAVAALFHVLESTGRDARTLAGVKIAAVGPATTERLQAFGIRPDFVPTRFTGEDVAMEFPGEVKGLRILIPRALEANESLPEILRERGAITEIVAAYETVQDSASADELRRRLEEKSIDAITFTSSSTVKNFAAAFGAIPPPIVGVTLACIGPSTAQSVREIFQREPDLVAGESTIAGLVEALRVYYRE